MDAVAKSKCLIFPLSLSPLLMLVKAVLDNSLGPDPANAVTRELGEWALIFLCICLAVTPLRKISGVNKLIRYRRMLGLFALFYSILHLLSYLAFMLGWHWQTLCEDLYKRPYIIAGAVAVLILSILGITSTNKMMRRLGRRWSKLHKLVYVAALLAVIHFIWLVRSDYTEAFFYTAIVVILLSLRAVDLSVFRRWFQR